MKVHATCTLHVAKRIDHFILSKDGVGQVNWLHISHNVPIDTFITVGNVKEKVFFMVLLQHRNRDEEFRDASFSIIKNGIL